MKLWQTILANITNRYEESKIMGFYFEKLFEKECYILLEKIKAVLEDDSLDDKECFERIECLVCLFEEIGSDCGTRHDFG